jgi:hypothetical protein
MRFRVFIVGAGLFAASVAPASALTFSFSQIAGTTLTSDETAAFQTAANAWASVFTDKVTVNVQIGFTALGTNILGGTAATFVTASGTAVKSLLTADRKDGTDIAAVSSLTGQPLPSTVAMTSAEARALGFTTAGVTSDGSIEFSTAYTYSTSRDANGNVAAGTYDLVGIAEHEIGHLLGFDSSIDGGTSGISTLLDAFRFSSPGTRSITTGAAYFSLTDGATSIASFSDGTTYQASHWLQGTGGLMDPALALGSTENITGLDITALDAIGWDVPEPASITVFALGLAGLRAIRRRRRR